MPEYTRRSPSYPADTLARLSAKVQETLSEFWAAPTYERWRLYTLATVERDRLELELVHEIISLDWPRE